MPFAALSRGDLFALLAQGQRAGVVVLTPNRRLAQALGAEFDAAQRARGLASWEAPDILPFPVFLERLWDDALHAEGGDAVPALLAPLQEAHLWEEAIRSSERGRGLLAIAPAADQCRAAWMLKHAWRIGDGAGNEDAEAFAEWSGAYLRRAGKDLDAARLPDAAARWVDASRTRQLVACAFDILPPQQREFLAACEAQGIEVRECEPEAIAGVATRSSHADAATEIDAAARWARERLEAGATRIGIVVPDLQLRRRQVVRAFTRVLCPGRHLPGAPRAALPFNVSVGEPLGEFPIVRAALELLAIAAGEVEFAMASRVVRSPFIGGSVTELSTRARLDAAMRRDLSANVSLARLVAVAGRAPLLRERLEAIFNASRDGATPRSPHDWARHWSTLLSAAGYPGERALDSAEFQAHARWHEALAEFARLERVAPRMGAAQALSRLRRLCGDTLFQPESPEAPVQVLGVLESSGLRFDALWIAGLTDDAWPLAARPNPFLPIALQKQAGVPEATAEASFELDRRLTRQWLAAAREIVVSHPLRDGDRELAPSPLIAAIALAAQDVPAFESYRDRLFAARALESVPDGTAPALAGSHAKGGTRVLADQAACPFRAFARHRLGARELETPSTGPDAATRGTLLHEFMARLWGELHDSAALASDLEPAIARAAEGAVAELGLDGRFAELERARLGRLALEWLAIERARPPFAVVAIEDRRDLEVAGLSLDARIDRMDRLADGTHLLVDYKSGNVTRQDWLGERPGDPQLPLYALGATEDVSAIAFARLKRGEMKYTGYGRDDEVVDRAKDWDGLKASWRAALETLARGFAGGDARVDPKKSLATCRHCDLAPLCRVHEKLALVDDEEEGA